MKAASGITQGERVRVFPAGAFTVVDATYLAPRRWNLHTHDQALISFAAAAEYEETVDGTRLTCRRGEYLVKPACLPHANRFDHPGTRCISIAVASSAAEPIPAIRRMFAAPRCLNSEATMFQSMVLMELSRRDELSTLALQGIVYELLATLGRSSKTVASESFLRARDYIHATVSESPTIEAIATAAGVHPGHLNRLFRRHAGSSTADYVRRLRLERAVRDLMETRLSIADIAVKHGYYDQSHFTNALRRYGGRSPAAYRRGAADSHRQA